MLQNIFNIPYEFHRTHNPLSMRNIFISFEPAVQESAGWVRTSIAFMIAV